MSDIQAAAQSGLARWRRFAPPALYRRVRDAGYWFDPRDVPLFLRGAVTDARVSRLRRTGGARAAFETIYRESPDPWASVTKRYRYQARKYRVALSLFPKGRRFRSALDLGCGLGEMSRLMADRADKVLGLDIAQSAVDRAYAAHGDHPAITFRQADLLNLPADLNGQFDLVMIADTLYYLQPMNDKLLRDLAKRVGELMTPGGVCVLVNHFFFSRDPESALSRKIHRIFEEAPAFNSPRTHWRPFYLTTFLSKIPVA